MNRTNWTFLLVMVALVNGVFFLPLAIESVHSATVPDIRGNWIENPSTGSARGCQNSAGNGLFSDAIGFGFTILNQTGRNFNFTRLRFDARPLSVTETCSGTVSSDGLVSSSCTYEETSNGAFKRSGTYTLTGSLGGNTLTYHITGQDLVGDTCQWDQRGTDTRSGSIPPPIILPIHTPFDLNGDGKADLVWRNMNNGVVAGWLMNGTRMASVGFPAGVPGEWQIEGIGDVNGDGKADVIWQHSVTGTVAMWLMNGLSITSVGFSGSTTPDWKIEGVGDVDGDGKADIIWRNQLSILNPNPGQVFVWLMDGANIKVSTFLAGLPLDWEIAGVGDMNEDGKSDIIWHNSINGSVAVWLMNGLAINSVVISGGTSTDWKIQGIGDVDGDGKADLVWRKDSNGVVALWLMDGASIVSTAFLNGVPSTWHIEKVADLNGDRKADVVWQNANGTVVVWLMNGTVIDSVGYPGIVASEWVLQP